MSLSTIEIIAFDADDTLWENETFFREAEVEFCEILSDFDSEDTIMAELFQVEVQNLEIYGYGIKAFILSLIETALLVSNHQISQQQIGKILQIGKTMLHKEVNILPGVEEVLAKLSKKYRLVMATKGDLLDQERKLKKSDLKKYFHHIEVMTHKKESNYTELINHLDLAPEKFLMIGNSLKSDILPVINLGGAGVHVPYHTTWEYEKMDPNEIKSDRFFELTDIRDVLKLLK